MADTGLSATRAAAEDVATLIVLLLSEVPPIRRIVHLDLAEASKIVE